MPESTLNLSLADLEAEVGQFLGWRRGANFGDPAWGTSKQRELSSLVKSGLSVFYFPTPLPGEENSYDWSFLRPIRSATLAEAANSMELPADFGGLEGDVLLVTDTLAYRAVQVTSDQLVARRHGEFPNRTGPPECCAVRVGPAATQTKSSRSDLYFFPAADAEYTVQFQYYFLPDMLIESVPYPHGGAVHAETIKAACLAKAELYKDNQPGPMQANFMERLRASISLDRRNKAETLGYNGDPGYNRPRWRQQIHGRNASLLTYNQS